MHRKKKYIKKYNKVKFRPDAFYRSFWFAKLTNKFMRQGKKAKVEKHVWDAFRDLKRRTKQKANLLLFFTLMKVRPILGFISKRLGREFKRVPVPLFPRRQIIVALKWLVQSINLNRSLSLKKRIRSELFFFIRKRPNFLKKRYTAYIADIHQNRLNGRFRWK
jgi:small subunit ribosomal protein S7